jgi:hypothetical protein
VGGRAVRSSSRAASPRSRRNDARPGHRPGRRPLPHRGGDVAAAVQAPTREEPATTEPRTDPSGAARDDSTAQGRAPARTAAATSRRRTLAARTGESEGTGRRTTPTPPRSEVPRRRVPQQLRTSQDASCSAPGRKAAAASEPGPRQPPNHVGRRRPVVTCGLGKVPASGVRLQRPWRALTLVPNVHPFDPSQLIDQVISPFSPLL